MCWMMLDALTGQKLNKWMLTMMIPYLFGWFSDADVLRELNRPDNRRVKLRPKNELWKKLDY